jgi:hypothetical protein
VCISCLSTRHTHAVDYTGIALTVVTTITK